MNSCNLIGNLTADPIVKSTATGKLVASFTIAVNDFTQTDFISCIAWEKSAELISKYFKKGSKIGINGKIKTRTYDDQSGRKVKVTEISVTTIDFLEKKNVEEEKEEQKSIDLECGFDESNTDITTDDLPF